MLQLQKYLEPIVLDYTAGGKQLQNQAVGASTATTTVDFDNLTWGAATTGAATFGAAFAAIYNSTNGNKIVVALDFGGTKTATNGDFTLLRFLVLLYPLMQF